MEALRFAHLRSNVTAIGALGMLLDDSMARELLKKGAIFQLFIGLDPLIQTWIHVPLWVKGLIGGLIVLCLIYLTSTIRYHKVIRMNKYKLNGLREAPTVPYWIPGLYHALWFLDPADCLLRLQRKVVSDTPLQLKAGRIRVFVLRNAEHIKAAFRASKKATSKSTTVYILRNLLKLPEDTAQFFLQDDSGIHRKPRQGSRVAPENRINYLISHNVKKYLSSDHLEDLNQVYVAMLLRHLDTFEVGEGWVEFPDLHEFVQRVAMRPSVEALVGSEFFKIYPDFVKDLVTFQHSIPDFLHLLPCWLIPRAYLARKRLLGGVKRWHKHAHDNYDCSRLSPEDPIWEPFFGYKLMRAREHYSLNTDKLTPDARASEDLGLIFAAATNVVTSMFWFFFEALKDPDILEQLMSEVAECTSGDGAKLEVKKLTTQPLLQSAYAEVLRLYVAIASSRIAEYQDIDIAGYSIPKDSYLVMYNRILTFEHQAWEQAGRTLNKPLEAFDAERFLVDADWVRPALAQVRSAPSAATSKGKGSACKKRTFTVDGLLGVWFPYGGGDHICPGRHYAKHQMMLTFAILFTNFDIELAGWDTGKVQPNMSFAPFGALPPTCRVPFRIRRKVVN